MFLKNGIEICIHFLINIIPMDSMTDHRRHVYQDCSKALFIIVVVYAIMKI